MAGDQWLAVSGVILSDERNKQSKAPYSPCSFQKQLLRLNFFPRSQHEEKMPTRGHPCVKKAIRKNDGS